MNYSIFPILTNERLELRQIDFDDVNEILFLRSNEKVTKFIKRPEDRKTNSKEDATRFIQKLMDYYKNNKSISWGITLKSNPKIVVGTICLWNFSEDNTTAEVGYDLHPSNQGKGIMSESLALIIEYGFGILNLDCIEAYTQKNNLASITLLEKNGFELNNTRNDLENLWNSIFELKREK